MQDLNILTARLERYASWCLKTVNSKGERKAYSCMIWSNGRRITSQAKTVDAAIMRALDKFEGKTIRLSDGSKDVPDAEGVIPE